MGQLRIAQAEIYCEIYPEIALCGKLRSFGQMIIHCMSRFDVLEFVKDTFSLPKGARERSLLWALRCCRKFFASSCSVVGFVFAVLDFQSISRFAVCSVSHFAMLFKNGITMIYQSLREVCTTCRPCPSWSNSAKLNTNL